MRAMDSPLVIDHCGDWARLARPTCLSVCRSGPFTRLSARIAYSQPLDERYKLSLPGRGRHGADIHLAPVSHRDV